MGKVVTGLMIGTTRSAGGINFYKRRGEQCFRNKPVLPEGYVPSEAQQLQKNLFSYVNDFAKSTGNMRLLLSAGWGGLKRTQGASNLNNFVGYYIRTVTRDEGGAKLPYVDVIANVNAVSANAADYWHRFGALTKSEWPIYYGSHQVTTFGSGIAGRIFAVEAESYRAELVQYAQAFQNSIMPRAIGKWIGLPELTSEPFIVVEGTEVAGEYIFQAVEDIIPGGTVQWALWFPRINADGSADWANGAITPHFIDTAYTPEA